jgi:beta-glucanase (GH16 family)
VEERRFSAASSAKWWRGFSGCAQNSSFCPEAIPAKSAREIILSGTSPMIFKATRTSLSGLILFFWLTTLQISIAQSSTPTRRGWTLTWSDEFNGPNGGAVDSTKWVSETGGNGWGNDELEYYTNRMENAYQHDGNLVIKVFREKYTGSDGVTRDYTSARLKTLGKFSQIYGRFEARIKIPRGQGIWPAFWMMGDNIDKVGWPDCGEVDIMENIGKEPALVHGTIHGPGYSGDKGPTASYALPDKKDFADDFHLYAVEWEPAAIRFYVDDHLYFTRTPRDLPPGKNWVFNRPFFLLLNVAVGGSWPGNPDASSTYPQTMLVDYVRVYRRTNSPPVASH